MSNTSTLSFHGGVGSVTGANFLLSTGSAQLLVDCGLLQGREFSVADNAAPFSYDPAAVDALFVTHAHADHIGRIPKLVQDGFTGTIYSTDATRALAEVMLADAYDIMRYEAEKTDTEPLYGKEDIERAFELWGTTTYGEPITCPDNVTATFTNAGHILGSAIVRFARNGRSIVFTGDIGNVPQPLMAPPDVPKGYHYLVMESVYGDREHEEVADRELMLLEHIQATIQRGGTLIIPAFSLERTQAILYTLNDFVESGTIDPIPVFLDSPLAIQVTELYQRYSRYLKPEIQDEIARGDDVFDFPKLSLTRTLNASREIHNTTGAKIIIAGSGMSHGGRIREHEKRYLDDPSTTLLLVGYQTVGSLGRKLLDGAKRVHIDGVEVRVKARVASIRGFSGHADREQLIDFVAHGGDDAEQVFVTMGEERASLFLVQRLRDYLGVNAIAPSLGEEAEIDF